MSALRDTDGKLDWAMLFEYFPLALPELCKARMFGARHYTKDGKDGRSNWRESINTDKHEEFFKGCIRGNISHNLKCLWGEDRDIPQDNVHHLAFGALNNLMALEYALARQELQEEARALECALARQELSTEECEDFLQEYVRLPCVESRYPWKDAPSDAKYAAIDSDGNGWWYTTRPKLKRTMFFGACGPIGESMLRDGEDWKTTLEERP